MKQLVILITVILFSLFACWGTKNKNKEANVTILRKDRCTIVSNMDSVSKKWPHILPPSIGIKVLNSKFYQLDTFTTTWNLTKEELQLFFETAKQIDHFEAARIINKRYHPFSIEGEIDCGDSTARFRLNPAGIAILYDRKLDSLFFFKYNNDTNNLFRLPVRAYPKWPIKILSKKKIVGKISESDSLYIWVKNWNLTVTEINEYLGLCKKEKEHILYQLFMNYPCSINGDAVWEDDIYSFKLECSGMTWMRKKIGETSDDKTYGFGCFDKKGEKYIYEIGLSSDE